MPLRLLCPLLLIFLVVLLLRKEEKKASLLQSYNLIIASGNSIRQKPICFSIALVQWERNQPYPAYCPKPLPSVLAVCKTLRPTGYSGLQLPPHFCSQAQLYLPLWRNNIQDVQISEVFSYKTLYFFCIDFLFYCIFFWQGTEYSNFSRQHHKYSEVSK